jgi:hypothetical protein
VAAKAAKTYDAVAEVRKVRDQLGEEMAGMTFEEQGAYLQKKLAEARRRRAGRRQPQR